MYMTAGLRNVANRCPIMLIKSIQYLLVSTYYYKNTWDILVTNSCCHLTYILQKTKPTFHMTYWNTSRHFFKLEKIGLSFITRLDFQFQKSLSFFRVRRLKLFYFILLTFGCFCANKRTFIKMERENEKVCCTAFNFGPGAACAIADSSEVLLF